MEEDEKEEETLSSSRRPLRMRLQRCAACTLYVIHWRSI